MHAILTALDDALAAFRFRRRKRSQEWNRQTPRERDYVHLSVGLSVVVPSVGVRYRDLTNILPERFGEFSTHKTLTSLTPIERMYAIEGGSEPIVRDVIEYGLPMIDRLHDRDFVVAQLKSDHVADWPVYSYSHRIRLLPILLVASGASTEAATWLTRFESEASARDQLAPRYAEFCHALRERTA